ncbi:GTPase required for pre-60S ribosomal subunit nuclear export and maturation, partial [Coemansia sp. RSA 1933]
SLNVTQKFSKIPVAADYLPIDLEGDRELREAERASKMDDDSDEASDDNNDQTGAESEDVAATSRKRKAKDLGAEVAEPGWDEIFQSAVGENSKEVDSELESGFSALESGDESEVNGESEQEDESESDSGDEDVDGREEPKTRAPGKTARMTTNKKKVGNHYYSTANVKNRNRNKVRPVAPDAKVKRMRKPGSWKVSKNGK